MKNITKKYILEKFDNLTNKYSWEDESTSEMVYSVKSFRDILEYNIDLLMSSLIDNIKEKDLKEDIIDIIKKASI